VVSEQRTPRNQRPKPGWQGQNELDLEAEREALRELINKFRRLPESDEGGFYRNVGRFIVRTVMKPH
jgi:hypothetical protein